ncbi:tyrosine-type recombinase/integrase [Cellulosilyticum sp. ST5]|uniref:tyrosine-type recombinase/integrase n=1 Tax=unclassified Cellulosilyticum TaxID=2643091 RepID=UPI000F8D32A2|nr:tyrosine-type recombinase/integrase [Cellulosilyticum sp. WCF-2]QEH69410.1 tyrosine-type recombinase/integrase [Cellulosilyticum sp. WCF-2]
MASYQERRQKYVTLKTRELLQTLPPYIFDFFRGIEHTSSANTRLAYAYDIRVYLNFLHESIPGLKDLPSIAAITLEQLESITPRDIERYLEYLSYYEISNKEHTHHAPLSPAAAQENLNNGQYHQNGQTGKARKLASIKTLYNYFYKQQRILHNPTSLVDMPKIYEKPIIKLDVDEIAKLLDVVESGEQLTDKQKIYHEFTRKRDLAIVAVLLGTGIRVSECVGINIEDIDFNYNGIKITRKGGNETIIYFSKEVEKILRDYLTDRRTKTCKDIDHPLFLSLQNKRISVRSVQLLVKKYSSLVTQLKKITPHKLRSTYGTQLYQETGDIYLVADVLGHKDVNTTKKHYAQMDDARKRYAASIIKLREE